MKKLILLFLLLLIPVTCSAEWRVLADEPEYKMAVSTKSIIRMAQDVYGVEEMWMFKGELLKQEIDTTGFQELGAKGVRTFYDLKNNKYQNGRVIYYDKQGKRLADYAPEDTAWQELDVLSEKVKQLIKEVRKIK